MFLEIVTPEKIVFSSKVISVTVPGINGEFQILKDHAAVVSSLKQGTIKIEIENAKDNEYANLSKIDNGKLGYNINSGTIELNNNKIILLAD